MSPIKISPLQASMLIVTLITSTSIIFLPGATAGRDAWLATLLGTLVGLLVAIVVIILGLKFPEKTILEYPELFLGKWPGKIVASLYIFFFLYLSILTLWDFGVFISNTLLKGTPVLAINLTGLLVAAIAAYYGIEVIARANQIFLPFIILSIILVILLIVALKNIHFRLDYLLPMLDKGFMPVIAGVIGVADWLGEALFLAMLIPVINKKKMVLPLLYGVIFSGILLTIIAITSIGVYNGNVANLLYPFYSSVLLIEISKVLRMELLIVSIWIIGVFIKLSFLLFITSYGTAMLAGLKNYRYVVLPLAIIILSSSLILISNTAEYESNILSISLYAVCMQLVLPSLILAVSLFRAKQS